MAVELAQDGEGNLAIGATIEGVFIPFATVAAHRVQHLLERQATLAARASDPGDEGHEQAQDALTSGFVPVRPASSKSSSGKASGGEG